MYVYTNEIFQKKSRKFNTVLWTSFYTLGGISVHLFSMRWNYFASYIWASAACIGVFSLSYWGFVESPFYLFGRGDVEGLSQCLARMCRWNLREPERARTLASVRSILDELPPARVKSANAEPLLESKPQTRRVDPEQPPLPTTSEARNAVDVSPTPSVLKLFFARTNLTRFVLVLCIHCTGYMIFGLGVIFNKNLGIDSIYLSGLLLTVPKLFSHLVTSIVVTRVRLRTLSIWVNAVIGVLAGALLVMNLVHNAHKPYADRSRLYRVAESGRLTSARNPAGDGRQRDLRLHQHLHGRADRHQGQEHVHDAAVVDRHPGAVVGDVRDRADGQSFSEPDDLRGGHGRLVGLRVGLAAGLAQVGNSQRDG